MAANRRPGTKKRPQTMDDVISLAPTASIEYILYSGLGSAVASDQIENRLKTLEQDKRAHSSTYKRIVLAYLQAELALRSQEVKDESPPVSEIRE